MNWKIIFWFLFFVVRDIFGQNTSIVLILDRRPVPSAEIQGDPIRFEWEYLAQSVIDNLGLSINSSLSNYHVRICVWNEEEPKLSNACGKVNKEIFSTNIFGFEKLNKKYELDNSNKAGPIVIRKFYIQYVGSHLYCICVHWFLFSRDK